MQTFPTMYNGMVDCFMKTLRTDGIVRGLYAGTMPSVVANVAENSILFAAYGGCQKVVANIMGKPEFFPSYFWLFFLLDIYCVYYFK